MFGSNREKEAMLYYLYMMADGDVSYSEKKIFEKLCKELSIDTETRESIIEKCKGVNTANIFSTIVREKLDDEVGQGWFGLRDASSLAQIIWNLVNLAYADFVYSDQEKKIVKYLVDKWAISTEIYQEFVDTADTMFALTKQRDWITSTFSEGAAARVDAEINQLLEDVKLTIEELTM